MLPSFADIAESARAIWRAELWRMPRVRGTAAALGALLGGKLDPGTVFRLHALARGENLAVIDGEQRLTYGELNRRACRLANTLVAQGIGRGQSVVLMLHNSAAYLEAQAACAKLRIAAVPVSWRLTSPELAYILEDARPAALFFDAELAPAVLGAGAREKGVRCLFSVGGPAPGCTPFEEALASGTEEEPPTGGESPAIVIYTSGTTGRPKGAVRTFKGQSSLKELVRLLRMVPLRYADVHLVTCPLYHSLAAGFTTVNIGLANTIALLRKFEPETFLAAVARHRVTSTALVPTMLRALVDLPGEVRAKYDLSSLRVIVVSGAALEHALVRDFAAAYGPDLLYNLYGATELGWVTIAGPRELLSRPETIGRAVPGCEIRLLDEEKREVPAGEVGELFVKSDLLIDRYHGNPEATTAARHGDFFSVGDLARRDADGFYFMAGRRVDMVISGGMNVYPVEIEASLLQHPAVAEAAVIGVRDEVWGEALRAFVVPRSGATLDLEELQAFLRGRLAGYKVPKQYRVVDALPRNPTGKVLKKDLRARP
jgi:fatty-acyl-CoA synthase